MKRFIAAGAMILTVLVSLPSGAGSAPQSGPGTVKPVYLRLLSGDVDPLTLKGSNAPAVPPGGAALYVVQFRDVITAQSHRVLTAASVEEGPYFPDYAFIVRGTAAQMASLSGNPLVRAVTRYRPEWKVAPSVSGFSQGRVQIVTFPGAQQNFRAAVQGIDVDRVAITSIGVAADVTKAQIPELIRREDVLYIEPVGPVGLTNDVAAGLVKVSTTDGAWAEGYSGQGQIVGVADTGLDTGDLTTLHPDLRGRVVRGIALGRPNDWSDRNGHGTHVTGSIVGTGIESSGQIRGMAPDAKVVFQSTEDRNGELTGLPDDLRDLFGPTYDLGARIHTNSWGHTPTSKTDYEFWTYNTDSVFADLYTSDHKDFTVLFAAGNQGRMRATETVSAPGNAKNVITVGASENDRSNLDSDSDDPGSIAVFSGRGNTPDRRIKPDVVAPGTWILSTRTSLFPDQSTLPRDQWHFWGEYRNHAYAYNGGTSMATPITAGSAALVRQYYTDVMHIVPAASLMKATLINGAQDLVDASGNRHGWMSKDQGWGRIDLQQSLFPPEGRVNWWENEAHALNTDDTQSYTFSVAAGQIFKATLVWTDLPGMIQSSVELVNDLDLEVTGPDGTTYSGNCFNAARTTAASGCSGDHLNNVENVYISAPQAGTYRLTVRGRSVIGLASQPYSLFVSGKNLAAGGTINCLTGTTGSASAAASAAPAPITGAVGGKAGAKQPPAGPISTMSTSQVSNRCAAANVGSDGRFNFGLNQPTTNTWYNTSFSWPASPWSSFTTLNVDGRAQVFGSGSGSFVETPHNLDSLTNGSLWRSGDITVRQTIQVGQNPSTARPDAAQIRYTVTNAGSQPHTVGLRLMIDTMLANNDGAPFRVPASGGMEAVTQEREYTGNGVPDFWQAFRDLSTPDLSVQMTLRGADATPPDRMVIAHWSDIYATQWDYAIDSTRSVTSDSAVGMWWNSSALQPGETRTYIVYYGRPRVGGTHMLTLSCPAQISQREWSTHPLDVVAYFNNNTPGAYPSISFELSTRLNLADGDPTHAMGYIAPGSSGQTRWRLQASVAGHFKVTVKAYSYGPVRKLIQRTECDIEAMPPAVPDNVSLVNTAGTADDGTPYVVRCRPLTVNADYPGSPSVMLYAVDAAGHSYTARMSPAGDGHFTHTFVPCSRGLTGSPLRLQLQVRYRNNPDVLEQTVSIILIDPSGSVYNSARGPAWALPGAQVTLQYYDPAVAAWVTLDPAAYPGRFRPVENPQITGSDGRYAWDAAQGSYRVRVSRSGFTDDVSRAVTIPPAVTSLDIGLTPTDRSAPVVAVSGATDGGFYPGQVTVALSATDTGGAGVRSVFYSLDGGADIQVDGSAAAVTVSAVGNHTLVYHAVDHAGNASAPARLAFRIGCSDSAPSLTWVGPLSSSASADIGATDRLPIRFQWLRCGTPVHDESVTVRIRDSASGTLIVGYTYALHITVNDTTGEYSQDFVPDDYDIGAGRQLNVSVYFGGKLVGTAAVNVH